MGTVKIEDLPRYTYADYVRWEGRWELINGIPYAMTPAPSTDHQRISQKIARFLDEALDQCEECRALLPVDWKIAEDTIVQPDNLVVCYEPEGAYIRKAPVLIFEILSKSSAARDQHIKFEIYEREGVKYYVIVEPRDQMAKAFVLKSGRYTKLADVAHEKLTFELGPCEIQLDFSKIWI